jgi:hypothetical protein
MGRFAKGGSVKKELEGYQGMYDYAIANNFTPSQLADELEFSTGLKDERDKKFYAHLKNLTRMFPDKPLSEFAKGGKVKRYIVHKDSGYDGEVVGSSDTFRGASMIEKRLEKKGVFDNVDTYGIKDTQDYFYRRKDNKYAKGGEVKKKGQLSVSDTKKYWGYSDKEWEDLSDYEKNKAKTQAKVDKDNKYAEKMDKSSTKKGDNSMLIGGLAGILLGIFLGRK